ncbi:BnaA10g29760D [Brassica napus]|uniref:Protein kinase domain-containing protein n=2 Tax=Brassica TaxID=3705 RepID=M4CWX7_BRACM|nr:unnamed protein product [Brassica napus]CDY69322.1 BnaA10g29760D [Brassica napus]
MRNYLILDLPKMLLVKANTHVSTRVMGTYGYAAPEYAMTDNASRAFEKRVGSATTTRVRTLSGPYGSQGGNGFGSRKGQPQPVVRTLSSPHQIPSPKPTRSNYIAVPCVDNKQKA